MKKIRRITALMFAFVLYLCNRCFADVVWVDPETGERHGGGTLQYINNGNEVVSYVLIGAAIVVAIIAIAFIIYAIVNKKNEKDNGNKNDDNDNLF